MKCPKCNSENTQIQAKEVKPKIFLGCCLAGGGLGLMILGIIGLVIGVLLGLLVGAILKSVLPTGYESLLVCQSCGCVTKMVNVQNIKSHPLFCPPDECNLIVIRDDEVKGTIVNLRVWIDNEPFDLTNGARAYLKLEEGFHHLKYEQTNGLDKKNRNGEFPVNTANETQIVFAFTRKGITVNRSKNQ